MLARHVTARMHVGGNSLVIVCLECRSLGHYMYSLFIYFYHIFYILHFHFHHAKKASTLLEIFKTKKKGDQDSFNI